eukprot:9178733-Heterocapsa_arctica.AAC.1
MDSLCPTKRPAARTTSVTTRGQSKGAGKGAKGQGKGKPAINPNYYAGYCYKCGKWGHRSTTCRVTVAAIFDE